MTTTALKYERRKSTTNISAQVRTSRRKAALNAKRAIEIGLPLQLLQEGMKEEVRSRNWSKEIKDVKNGNYITRVYEHETGETRTYVSKDKVTAMDTANLDYLAYGKPKATYIIALRIRTEKIAEIIATVNI